MIKVSSFPEKKRKTIAQQISINSAVLLIIGLTATTTIATTTTVAYAQEEVEELQTYEYPFPPGVAFEYPAGWVIQDFGQYGAQVLDQLEKQLGHRGVFAMCPEDVAISALGGGYDCQAAGEAGDDEIDAVYGFGVTNLNEKIAERGLGTATRTATVDDVFAYHFDEIVGKDNPDTALDESKNISEIVSRERGTVDVVNSQTDQVIGQADSMLVEYTYESSAFSFAPEGRSYVFVAIYNNNGISLGVEGVEDELESGDVPEVMQTIVDTFRFIA